MRGLVIAKYKPMPPFEEVDRLLRYEPETGKLYWKVQPRTGKRIKGTEAGCLHKCKNSEYRRIKINQIEYLVHRIAWLLYYKEDPGEKQIDHKNNNGLNNWIGNLRIATNTQNQYNTGKKKVNTSGYKGVQKSKSRSHYTKPYSAKIQIDGKTFYLGTFRTPEEASEAYQRSCKEHHGEFYHE